MAVKSFRKGGYPGRIGITFNPVYSRAATNKQLDILATDLVKACRTDIFTFSIFKGIYPRLAIEKLGFEFKIEKGDMEIISEKIDFYGVNYYFENIVEYDASSPLKFKNSYSWQEKTLMNWPISLQGLARCLKDINNTANGLDMYITENGIALEDTISSDGHIHDKARIKYYYDHLKVCKDAIEKGIPLKGFFAWSLLDNFEWSYGYSKRFGITFVDFDKSCNRIIKDRGYFLRDVILGLI